MDLIAQRGIAAHYCGKVFVDNSPGHTMRRNLKGKSVGLNDNNIAFRVCCQCHSVLIYWNIIFQSLL